MTTIPTDDLSALVEASRQCLRLIHRRSKEYVYAVHDFGLLLLPVRSRYGEDTFGVLAQKLSCSVTFLRRARDFAEVFPTRDLLDADIAKKEANGTPILIRDYYLNAIASKGEVRRELVEAKVEDAVEAVETLKATTPEVPSEEVASYKVVAQETLQDLRAHVAEGSEDVYHAWLRTQSCVFCGDTVMIEVAHLPRSKGAGGGEVLPVCAPEHRLIHQVGLATFFGMDLVSVERIEYLLSQMAKLYLAYFSRRGIASAILFRKNGTG